MAEVVLELRDVRTRFRKQDGRTVCAVDGVSFSVKKGQVFCLVGESGCGKSVTALSIMGLLPKSNAWLAGGSIRFEGQELTRLKETELAALRGNGISMIFQDPMTALNPVLTIGDQVAEVLITHAALDRRAALRQAANMLKRVGIPRAEAVLREYPHQLSGGMRQRVVIAMALICNPNLLIADEPTTALDVTIQAQVLALISQMIHADGTTVILITHDMGVVSDMADMIAVMYAGQIVELADADALFRDARHPYTKALMSAIPFVDRERDRLYSIPGTVPDAADFPKGCRFAARCERHQADICDASEEIPLVEVAPGRFVRCVRARKEERGNG
ncbi:MAG: ABC transporter ATP-binding protein [Clostridiales bacterium]|nr:ABC transporter ATP-binding protein [Clostridiales bacterium]